MTAKKQAVKADVVLDAEKPAGTDLAISKAVGIQSNITFDDIVNIFIDKYETELHEKRASIQASLRAALVERETFTKDTSAILQKAALATFQAAYPLFTLTIGDAAWDGKEKYTFNIAATVSLPAGITSAQDHYHRRQNSDNTKTELGFSYLSVDVDAAILTKMKELVDAEEELKRQLLETNAALQGIDRKTRKVKAALAEQRLEAEGLTALLESQQIKDILKIGN